MKQRKFTDWNSADEQDYAVRNEEGNCANQSHLPLSLSGTLAYLTIGIIFGIVFVKAEIISWFRMQEMFRFQSFHMYGVIGSAVGTAMLGVWLIKKSQIKTWDGEPVRIPKKPFHKGQIWGSVLFGIGWAFTGACPGPLYAQIGSGATVILITLLSALLGTWCYGKLRHRLPH